MSNPSGSFPKVVAVRAIAGGELATLLQREWLVTNGLGGYASGTVSGAATRRYHGLLIAAHTAPLGRLMMLNHVREQVRFPGWNEVRVGGTERHGLPSEVFGSEILTEFRLEMGLPIWTYHAFGHTIEKRVYMPYRHNTVHLTYRLLEGDGPVRVKIRPSVNFRGHDDFVGPLSTEPYTLTARAGLYELSDGKHPTLRMRIEGSDAAFTLDGISVPDVLYRVEENRGYDSVGTLWSPGVFRITLNKGEEATLTASTASWESILALPPHTTLAAEQSRLGRLVQGANVAVREGFGAELVIAADQFIITPAGRAQDAARMHAAGDEPRTVIAGYHWFTDWGRDTMISLEGLTLTTGRFAEAGYILRTFAHYVKDGLIPNLFPEHSREGLYHTADATLWFFHALRRYEQITGDSETIRQLLPTLISIVEHHLKGTHFGIGVDPKDGLLKQGAPGYQLTWMDAKVGDWVVTPRRGKAVEINALWHNAVKLLEAWLREAENFTQADELAQIAKRTYESFNSRFWYAAGNHLYDVVDGEDGSDDPACRPNQIFAIALDYPVLQRAKWQPVLEVVREKLVTPVGLRSLAPGHPDYKAQYYGDLRSRDAAYHQGTVWAWLIGPFIDAWLKVYPQDLAGGRKFLEGFEAHLSEACVGSISEVFDAESPFTPRACIAQAWSVAEVLRTWAKTATNG